MRLSNLITAFLMIIILYSPTRMSSQTVVSGIITDQDQQSIPYVNVLLLEPGDSMLVKGEISDEEGRFSIRARQNRTYLLQFRFIGYQEMYQTIETSQERIDLGIISLSELSEELEEVVITREKPLFEQKVDRTIVNIAGSITASSGSALDILEKAPGVTVDRLNSSISLAGKQGVRVMINGKMSRMPLTAVTQMLDGMNAETVESVELITTPPANFEAEGDAGIINVVMKQSDDLGINGSYSVYAGYGESPKAGGSINFNYRKNNFDVYGNYSYSYNQSTSTVANYRERLDTAGRIEITDTESNRFPRRSGHNGQIGFDYKIGNRTIVGANTTFYNALWNMDALNHSYVSFDDKPSYYIGLENTELNHVKYYISGVSISQELGEHSDLVVQLDYILYDSENPTEYTQLFEDFDGSNTSLGNGQILSEKVTPIHTWVPGIDYTLNMKEGFILEAGVKGSINKLDNDVKVTERVEGGEWVSDSLLSRNMNLAENILAGYASLTMKINASIDFKAGLRYEYTLTDLDSKSEQNLINRQYGKLFPSVFFIKKFDNYKSGVLSYSRRISRPTFRDIAPFVIFLDPNTFWTGNEALRPTITDAVKAEMRLNTYLFTLQYSHDADAIVRNQPRLADDGVTQLMTAENIKSRNTVTLSAAIPVKIADWWDMRYNVAGNYNTIQTSHLGSLYSSNNFSASINGQMNFSLPGDYAIELAGNYRTPNYTGIIKVESSWMLNLGVEKTLKENKGAFRFTITDIFRSRGRIGLADVPGENIYVRSEFSMEGLIFNLTYSRKLGNSKLKKIQDIDPASAEERQRIR